MQNSSAMDNLYPGLTTEERAEAEANLNRYLALGLRIFERTELSPAAPLTGGTGTLPCTPPESAC